MEKFNKWGIYLFSNQHVTDSGHDNWVSDLMLAFHFVFSVENTRLLLTL